MDLKIYFSCPGFPYRQIGKTKQNKYEVNKDISPKRFHSSFRNTRGNIHNEM